MSLYNNIFFNTGFLCGINNWFTPSFMFCNPVRSFNMFNFLHLLNSYSVWNNYDYRYSPPDISVFSMPDYTLPSMNFEDFKVDNTTWNSYNFNFSGIPSFNNFDSFNLSCNVSNTNNSLKSSQYNNSYKKQLVEKALSYDEKVNSDTEGNRLFSNSNKRAWCADFVTYNAKAVLGNKLPADFGCVPELKLNSSSVSGIQEWAKKNNCYLRTNSMTSQEKANYIAKNIKPGYIMIEKDNGKSHTGIVTEVHSDGSFVTIEGNCTNKVQKQNHTADSTTLSGFVTLDKYCA